MNNNNTPPTAIDTINLNELRPLPFEPEPITYTGRFIGKTWDTEKKDGEFVTKDLVLKVALDKKNELGQPVVVVRRYNMLKRARGISDFRKDMADYFGYKIDKKDPNPNKELFPARFLADQSLVQIDNLPVIVRYKKGRGNIASFDSFLPVETSPAAAPVATKAPANVAAPESPAQAAVTA